MLPAKAFAHALADTLSEVALAMTGDSAASAAQVKTVLRINMVVFLDGRRYQRPTSVNIKIGHTRDKREIFSIQTDLLMYMSSAAARA
jgi:hypothetical protein